MLTYLTLKPKLYARVKERAAALRISKAEYIRQVVDLDLGPERTPSGDVSSIIGIGSSGGSDILNEGKLGMLFGTTNYPSSCRACGRRLGEGERAVIGGPTNYGSDG